jgi:hypothetical protein
MNRRLNRIGIDPTRRTRYVCIAGKRRWSPFVQKMKPSMAHSRNSAPLISDIAVFKGIDELPFHPEGFLRIAPMAFQFKWKPAPKG